MRHILVRISFLLAASLPAVTLWAAEEQPAATPKKIENFSLRDYRGKVVALSDYAASKLVVVAFVGNDCPIAKLAMPRLVQLARQFAPQGVAFLAINSNSQDSLTGMAAFAREHDLPFPLLKDPGNVVADRFGAQRTPEIFVLDADRGLRYQGRLDDRYLVGLQRPQPTREDLKLAIEQLLAGHAVSTPRTEAVGCHVGRVPQRKPDAASTVTYSDQIARLLQDRCVGCHRPGEVAPFPLTTYEEVAGWGETIREVVEQRRMPPWLASPEHGHFANDARLTDAEKKLIYDWLDAGAPEGDPQRLPPPREFTVGWQIPQPDQVIYIRDEPVSVPAEGTVAYQYFEIDPGFQEDKWIQMAEARPGNRAVVHHIVVNFIPPGSRSRVGLNGSMAGYAPGIPPIRLPQGTAMFVPAGSKVLFQVHYTPNGSPQRDRSMLGLVFADPASVTERVDGSAAANVMFEIPPGADSYEVRSQYRFNNDTRLLTLMPHMHLRGKSFRYEAQYPDGSTEVLLDVPRYDFNWQLRYLFSEPKPIPKGTLLVCTAHFDNSPGNLANPDPQKKVRWGDQTWDEMMIGYFSTVSPRTSVNPNAPRLPAVTVRDDEAARRQAKELVRQGTQALGGAERLAATPVLGFKIKGTAFVNQTPMAFVGTSLLDPLGNRYRLAIMGLAFRLTVVLDRDRSWVKPGEQTIELPPDGVDEQRERMYCEAVTWLYPLLSDDAYQLSLITDAKVRDQPADGVLVRRAGHREVRLYFQPESHLLLKSEYVVSDAGRDIGQETLLDDYADFDGVQRPRKALLRWDGADRAQREMSDYRGTAEAPPDAFAKP